MHSKLRRHLRVTLSLLVCFSALQSTVVELHCHGNHLIQSSSFSFKQRCYLTLRSNRGTKRDFRATCCIQYRKSLSIEAMQKLKQRKLRKNVSIEVNGQYICFSTPTYCGLFLSVHAAECKVQIYDTQLFV